MTREYQLTMPSIAETRLTRWLATIRFTSDRHDYVVRFVDLRAPQCLCDGEPIDYYALPVAAKVIINEAADALLEAKRRESHFDPEESNR